MEFDAAGFLDGLFKGSTPAADDPPAPAVCEYSPTGNGAVVADHSDHLKGQDHDDRPIVSVLDLDELVEAPPPCPQCGSLELWETTAGTWRCQHCDAAAFRRSLDLIELAARLRAAALPRTAVQDRTHGVAGTRVDTLTLERIGPAQGIYGALAGCEDEQGGIARVCNGSPPGKNQNRVVDTKTIIR